MRSTQSVLLHPILIGIKRPNPGEVQGGFFEDRFGGRIISYTMVLETGRWHDAGYRAAQAAILAGEIAEHREFDGVLVCAHPLKPVPFYAEVVHFAECLAGELPPELPLAIATIGPADELVLAAVHAREDEIGGQEHNAGDPFSRIAVFPLERLRENPEEGRFYDTK